MEAKTLRSVLPFVKEYAVARGKHDDQQFPGDYYLDNAIGAIVHQTGIKRLPHASTYCYDNLNNGLGVSDPQAVLIQLQPCPESLDLEAYRHYIQWVLNYSPWRHVFVTKSINRALKTGVVVVDPSSQKNTMIGGMIAVRQAWDNYAGMARYKQIGLWWELVQKADPLFSFGIVSDLIYPKGKKTIALGTTHAGHSPIGYAGGHKENIDNFVQGKLKDDSPPWNESRSGKAWHIWCHGKDSKLPSLVEQSLAGIGKDKAKVNVFGADKSGVYDRQLVIDCLISEMGNMEKEIAL